MKNIGIFGGTFNPIHNAHLSVARAFYDQAGLDKCFFIPAYISPTKKNVSLSRNLNAEYRIEMIIEAIKNDNRFELDDYEIRKEGISYTIDTIMHYKIRFPESNLYMTIGSDQLIDFKSWKEWDKILENIQLFIAERPGYKLDDSLANELNKYSKSDIDKLVFEKSYISSSLIRNKLVNRESVKDMLPEQVINYIKNNNLYLD